MAIGVMLSLRWRVRQLSKPSRIYLVNCRPNIERALRIKLRKAGRPPETTEHQLSQLQGPPEKNPPINNAISNVIGWCGMRAAWMRLAQITDG
jgi:hypothetical protein